MGVLSFILECAAIAALLGTAALGVTLGMALALHPVWGRLRADLRADVAFFAGVLPGLVAVVGTAAAALPPLAAALGLSPDHCPMHTHHVHLCLVHSAGLRPAIAALGAVALAVWLFRAGQLGGSLWAMRRDVAGLERLGRATGGRYPVIEIPGSLRLCHAAGILRRRILVSDGLLARLRPIQLDCALAHERTHLGRHDPLANLMLSIAGLFQPPFAASVLQRAHRIAAEEACDDEAARVVGDGALVADALVAVAAAQRALPAFGGAPAFGAVSLERRVRRLLSGVAPRRRSRVGAIAVGASTSLALCLFATLKSAFFHHEVETLLAVLF